MSEHVRQPKTCEDVIQGKKDICMVLKRSWPTVAAWIKQGAPIALIHGVWEADRDDLLAWRREYIRRHWQESHGG